MGVSTDGIICFGVSFEDEYEFPWSEHDDIEDWWLEDICKFNPTNKLYDKDGGYINGERPTDEEYDAYFKEKDSFKKLHPLPVAMTMHCSGDYPMYIMTVSDGLGKSNIENASRGYPVEIDFNKMVGKESDWEKTLKDFCEKFNLEYSEPKWYLCSLWF